MYIIIAAFGLCFGSFVNAWVWRLHEQAKPRKRQAKVNLSITTGRSVCTHCGHELAARDLVPVFSWLWLRGKCRYCGKPIGAQYPLIELLTALAFTVSYAVWQFETGLAVAQLIIWLSCVVVLIALLLYDLRWMELPDKLVAGLTVLTVSYVVIGATQAGSVGALWGPLLGILPLAGLFYVLFQASDGKWIGGGDVKIGVPLGLLAGSLINSILVLLVASLVGVLVVLPLLVTGRKHLSQKIPFGPFLILATMFVVLWGSALVTWYQTQILLL